MEPRYYFWVTLLVVGLGGFIHTTFTPKFRKLREMDGIVRNMTESEGLTDVLVIPAFFVLLNDLNGWRDRD